eukprot:4934263-Pyramimonas_sp.AAC.1
MGQVKMMRAESGGLVDSSGAPFPKRAVHFEIRIPHKIPMCNSCALLHTAAVLYTSAVVYTGGVMHAGIV